MTVTRKSYKAKSIPEAQNKLMREGLRQLRESRGLFRRDVTTLSESSLQNYEGVDLSTMRIGDAIALAAEYGIEVTEFFTFILEGVDDVATEGIGTDPKRRIEVYLRNLDEHQMELALDLIQQVASYANAQRARQLSASTE